MAMFQGTNTLITGGIFTQNTNEARIPIQVISQVLEPFYSPSGTHDNNVVLYAPKCHPGTRVAILNRLSNWVKDSESPFHASWLHGPAGAGKSAIAHSLAESLNAEGLLAGSFFFFRSDASRNSEKALVATLSYQLARSFPDTQLHIAKSLEDDPAICSLSLRKQFKVLIVDPIRRIVAPAHGSNPSLRPMLIIIDGLDECVDQGARNLILQAIYDTLPCLNGQLKFLILSRPEIDIKRSFDSAPANVVEHINNLELLPAYDDVCRYLHDSFDDIKKTHPFRAHFPPGWPSDRTIEKIAEKSSGHFIYASTVIKYIQHDFDRPQRRLEDILNLRSRPNGNPYAMLDELYLNILTSSRTDRRQLINILSTVVFGALLFNKIYRLYKLETPKALTYRFVETILFLEDGDARIALLDLSSLLKIEQNLKEPSHTFIQFWHKSFSDFLLDISRSREFYARSRSVYTMMTKGCLQLLSDKTGLMMTLWPSALSSKLELRLICHLFLSHCCVNALPDSSLQKAMMEYEVISLPIHIHPVTRDNYFRILCSCLWRYQHASAFEGTKIVACLLDQFDNYLKSELSSCLPLDPDLMNVLQASILPNTIQWTEFHMNTYSVLQTVNGRNPPWPYFLTWMAIFSALPISKASDNVEATQVCEFFHSKDRAGEYYLGHCNIGILSLIQTSCNFTLVMLLIFLIIAHYASY